jgi:diguanylate cyclase (GGDEF)-like protein
MFHACRTVRRGNGIIADLNGLKTANDELGHAVGDALLRRAREVFGSLVERPASVARIGGDEFAVLLPATDIAGGEAGLATLAGLIELNNQYYPDFELSISIGPILISRLFNIGCGFKGTRKAKIVKKKLDTYKSWLRDPQQTPP